MNQQQVESMLRLLLGAGGPLAALLLSYGVPPDKLNLWVNLAIAVLPPLLAGAWGIAANTHKQTIADAAKVPGVVEVRTADNAKDGALAATEDPKLTNVKPMSAP